MSRTARRAFITLLGGAAVSPLAVLAQKSDAVRRIGIIMGFAEDDAVWQAYLATFRFWVGSRAAVKASPSACLIYSQEQTRRRSRGRAATGQ
jgi:hypothetical protein